MLAKKGPEERSALPAPVIGYRPHPAKGPRINLLCHIKPDIYHQRLIKGPPPNAGSPRG